MSKVIDEVLSRSLPRLDAGDFGEYWRGLLAHLAPDSRPIDCAVLGGAVADRLAFAFAAGYQAAGRVLDPSLPLTQPFALCVTEKGGGHPSAILSTLRQDGAGYLLNGSKLWTSMADLCGVLFVIASVGQTADGRNDLRLARVPADMPGVSLRPMPPTPFIPEIGHFSVEFEQVQLSVAAVDPGDAYLQVVKPFRTIEDVHVNAAVVSYLLAAARCCQWPATLCAELLQLLSGLIDLALADPNQPATHLRLAGQLALQSRLAAEIDAEWERAPAQERERWRRDVPLLSVAARARQRRFAVAWERITGQG